MGLFVNLFRPKKAQIKEAPDVSEIVSDVVGGGLLGLAVGELAEEGVKIVTKKRAKKKELKP